jgi:hypothetical protein
MENITNIMGVTEAGVEKIVLPLVLGFVGGWIAMNVQEHGQRRLLRESLYQELATIYLSLKELLPQLSQTSQEASRPNLPAFIEAPCFDAAKSSALFWRLEDSRGILKAHRRFSYLKEVNPKQTERDTRDDVRLVLDGFRSMFDSSRESAVLSRNRFIRATNGKATKEELTGATKP